MQSLNLPPSEDSIVEVNGIDRWFAYRRLQELSIPCWCEGSQPLRVQLHDCAAIVQLWSVMRQYTASRNELLCWLETCWQTTL